MGDYIKHFYCPIALSSSKSTLTSNNGEMHDIRKIVNKVYTEQNRTTLYFVLTWTICPSSTQS